MIFIDIKRPLKDIELNVKFNVQKGEFLAITGESGSGKTTLLRVLAGLEKAEGKIVVDEEIWQDKKVFLPPQKREIGFVFQDFALFPNMRVIDNLLFVKKDIEFANYLLKISGIEGLKDRYPNNLSGGEKQRVAIARALMRRPKILILDEPFSALDEKRKEDLQNKLYFFHKEFNLTTIMVTHSLNEVYKLADNMIKLKKGKIVKYEKVKNLGKKELVVRGKVVDILKDKVIVSVGSSLVEVGLEKDKIETLKIDSEILMSIEVLNPKIKVLNENIGSGR